jgi:hypothetical protein
VLPHKQNGDLYFEKFLRDFVSPLLDKWRSLGVSHMLTVVFFSRTLFLERVTSNVHPGRHCLHLLMCVTYACCIILTA